MIRRIAIVISAILIAASTAVVIAHGGGTDSQGGHHDRKNGGYHFHSGPLKGQSFSSKEEATRALQAAQKKEPGFSRDAVPDKPVDATVQVQAMRRILIEKGVFTQAEFDKAVQEVLHP